MKRLDGFWTRFEDTDVPIFTAEFEVLTKIDRIQADQGDAVCYEA